MHDIYEGIMIWFQIERMAGKTDHYMISMGEEI
jgi:hypothetical protein